MNQFLSVIINTLVLARVVTLLFFMMPAYAMMPIDSPIVDVVSFPTPGMNNYYASLSDEVQIAAHKDRQTKAIKCHGYVLAGMTWVESAAWYYKAKEFYENKKKTQ